MVLPGAAGKENTIEQGQMLPHQWGSRVAESCRQEKHNIDVSVQPHPLLSAAAFPPSNHFIFPISSLTHSLHPLQETEGTATGLVFLQTWCPLLITAGGCFHFSPAPVDMIWGRDGEARGVGWLGVGSADGLCFSFLMPILQILPARNVVLHGSI